MDSFAKNLRTGTCSPGSNLLNRKSSNSPNVDKSSYTKRKPSLKSNNTTGYGTPNKVVELNFQRRSDHLKGLDERKIESAYPNKSKIFFKNNNTLSEQRPSLSRGKLILNSDCEQQRRFSELKKSFSERNRESTNQPENYTSKSPSPIQKYSGQKNFRQQVSPIFESSQKSGENKRGENKSPSGKRTESQKSFSEERNMLKLLKQNSMKENSKHFGQQGQQVSEAVEIQRLSKNSDNNEHLLKGTPFQERLDLSHGGKSSTSFKSAFSFKEGKEEKVDNSTEDDPLSSGKRHSLLMMFDKNFECEKHADSEDEKLAEKNINTFRSVSQEFRQLEISPIKDVSVSKMNLEEQNDTVDALNNELDNVNEDFENKSINGSVGCFKYSRKNSKRGSGACLQGSQINNNNACQERMLEEDCYNKSVDNSEMNKGFMDYNENSLRCDSQFEDSNANQIYVVEKEQEGLLQMFLKSKENTVQLEKDIVQPLIEPFLKYFNDKKPVTGVASGFENVFQNLLKSMVNEYDQETRKIIREIILRNILSEQELEVLKNSKPGNLQEEECLRSGKIGGVEYTSVGVQTNEDEEKEEVNKKMMETREIYFENTNDEKDLNRFYIMQAEAKIRRFEDDQKIKDKRTVTENQSVAAANESKQSEKEPEKLEQKLAENENLSAMEAPKDESEELEKKKPGRRGRGKKRGLEEMEAEAKSEELKQFTTRAGLRSQKNKAGDEDAIKSQSEKEEMEIYKKKMIAEDGPAKRISKRTKGK